MSLKSGWRVARTRVARVGVGVASHARRPLWCDLLRSRQWSVRHAMKNSRLAVLSRFVRAPRVSIASPRAPQKL